MSALFGLACAALLALATGGCRHAAREPERDVTASPAAPVPSVARVEAARSGLSESPADRPRGAFEAELQRDPLARFLPAEQAHQRVAFSRYRLAALSEPPERATSEALVVRRLGDLGVVARVAVPGARNVAALTGGGFLVAGRDHVYRLSGVERRAELLPRAPRIGPTTLLPSSQEASQFWLRYAGIDTLSRFDLAQTSPLATLVPLDFTVLSGFDHNALSSEGDGAFVYTDDEGLVRVDASGSVDRMPRPDLGGRIFELLPAERRDRVWAVTLHHAYLLHVRGEAETVETIALPPRPVALAARGRDLAVLSVEKLHDHALGLRVDVHLAARGDPRVLRLSVPWNPRDEPASARFELDLAPEGDWVAAHAKSLFVGDFRRAEWLISGEPAAQNLAPSPP